jgi:uncharacterized phiE125 gp8 family phage protein
MNLTLITPPTTLPVTLDAVKHRVRVSFNDDDDDISQMIATATSYLDGARGYIGGCLLSQTWELTVDWRFPDKEIPLSLGPVQSITSVNYIDPDGVEQTLDSFMLAKGTNFNPSYLTPAYGQQWPSVRCQRQAIKVRFVAGYQDAASVPAQIKQAIMVMVCQWYQDREGVDSGIIPGAEAMLNPFRSVVM